MRRILWIPHQQLANTNQTRCEYLAAHLIEDEHRVLHWRRWNWSWRDLITLSRGVEEEPGANRRFVFVRLLVVNRLFWWLLYKITGNSYAHAKLWLGYSSYNNYLLNRAIHKVINNWQPDVLIFANNAIGQIDLKQFQNIVTVFDYVDLPFVQHRLTDDIIRTYVNGADVFTCVSKSQLEDMNSENGFYLPNGLDRIRLGQPQGQAQKDERTVISLIGLTCSHRLYFIDAIKTLIDEGLPVLGLIVGSGSMFEPIRQRIQGYESDFKLTGQVAFDEIQAYFDMTDIGLYPVDDTPYFRAASPIKCFEYSYRGCHVLVSPYLPEVAGYNLPNTWFCDDNQEALVETLRRLATLGRKPTTDTDFDPFDWSERARALDNIIRRVQSS